MDRVPGKLIVAGYEWSQRIAFKPTKVSFPLTATFTAHVRERPSSDTILATLTSANGGVVRVNAYTLELVIPAATTAAFDVQKVWIDVARDDVDPKEYLGFRLGVPVRVPVTRP